MGLDWVLLDVLSEPERDQVTARMQMRRYRRGDVVCNHGDVGETLWVVENGRFDVQLATPEGQIMVVRVVHTGEFFGELALVHPHHRRIGRVTALEPSVAHALHRRDFEELRRNHPGVDRLLVAALAERVEATSAIAVELLRPADVRIWRRLRTLAAATTAGDVIRVSQEDLARMSATTRQTVNRVLAAGEATGALRRHRGSIQILDCDALDRLAD